MTLQWNAPSSPSFTYDFTIQQLYNIFGNMNTYIGTVREREQKGLERKNPIDALVVPKRI